MPQNHAPFTNLLPSGSENAFVMPAAGRFWLAPPGEHHTHRHHDLPLLEQGVDSRELRADSEAEAVGLDPEQWIGGEFNFDEWLSGSILTGNIEKVDTDPERTAMRIASGTKLCGSAWRGGQARRGGQANIASCSEQKRLSNAG